MARYDTISFLSDYGWRDEFVGVTKSVIRGIAPHTTVIDISHSIPAFDIRAGSLALVRSAPYLNPGVVLAVVDPGVGSMRRSIAVEVGDGESVLVGPDNALLAPAVALVGGATRAVELTNPAYRTAGEAATFQGRDVFAPAAAHICNGVDIEELGPRLDPSLLRPSMLPFSAEENGVLQADVLWVDHYGNVQLNVSPEQLQAYGVDIKIVVNKSEFVATRVADFESIRPGGTGLITDANGLVAIVLHQASAAERFALAEQDSVTLSKA